MKLFGYRFKLKNIWILHTLGIINLPYLNCNCSIIREGCCFVLMSDEYVYFLGPQGRLCIGKLQKSHFAIIVDIPETTVKINFMNTRINAHLN